MFKTLSLAAAIAVLTIAAPTVAQTPGRTLDAFLTEANRIPMNPTALVRPSARRIMNEATDAMGSVVQEARAAQAAGRPSSACPPEKISVNGRQVLGFLNAIPQPRRARMSVRDGFRAWLADSYPCR
jgi:predicted phage tail protein